MSLVEEVVIAPFVMVHPCVCVCKLELVNQSILEQTLSCVMSNHILFRFLVSVCVLKVGACFDLAFEPCSRRFIKEPVLEQEIHSAPWLLSKYMLYF